MKVIYLISLQNPNRFYTVVFLYYCSSLTCNATGDAADCLETPGVRDDALGIVTCLLVEVRWQREKQGRKASVVFSSGSNCAKYFREFVSEKAGLCL